REISLKPASPLELPQDRVIVLEELQPDVLQEVVRVLAIEPPPPGGMADDVVDVVLPGLVQGFRSGRFAIDGLAVYPGFHGLFHPDPVGLALWRIVRCLARACTRALPRGRGPPRDCHLRREPQRLRARLA